MKINKSQHLKQLQLLGYQEGETIYYRSIAPEGNGNASNDSRKFPTLISYQNKEKGLYFVVNGGGQKDKDVTHGKALFCEWDYEADGKTLIPLDVQENFWKTKGFIQPTFQVRTRKSVHCYWVFDQPINIEDWKILETNLLNLLDGDRTLKNPSRVLRVAGAWHLKPGQDPIQCELINVTEKRYSQGEIEAALMAMGGEPEPPPAPKTPPSRPLSVAEGSAPPIPLIQCISLEHRRLVESGAVSNRNAQGAALARDLIGAENWLRSNGIPYSEDAELLFRDYCLKCDPKDWSEREWDLIWK